MIKRDKMTRVKNIIQLFYSNQCYFFHKIFFKIILLKALT